MNQVDLFIIAVVAAFAISGARRGLISSAGDIITLALSLIVGSVAYPAAAAPLRYLFSLSPAVAGPLGFVMVAAVTATAGGWVFSLLAAKFELEKGLSRAGGAGFGAAFGIFLAAVLVMGSAMVPGLADPVGNSAFAPRITGLVPRLHENMDSIGIPLPKLVQLPTDYRDELRGVNQGLQFLRVNFTKLDGATCIHCRSPVAFEGYVFSRGTLISPRFRCTNCGRTSDGCQTFEGFHAIYGECPVTLAREGLQFDCGVWTNNWWTVPHGRCPVCGKSYRPEPEVEEGCRPARAVTPAR